MFHRFNDHAFVCSEKTVAEPYLIVGATQTRLIKKWRKTVNYSISTRVLTAAVCLLAINPLSVFPGTSQFHGVNWADERDNYNPDALVLGGLSLTDSHDSVVAKANAVLAGFEKNIGCINTIRIPVNPPTVTTAWWASYRGIIDAVVAKPAWNIIICPWESSTTKDGLIDNTAQFWTMWKEVVSRYGNSSNVYFEIFNEPFGYTASQLTNIYAAWLDTFPSVPRNRILCGGTGWDDNVTAVGADSRLTSCLLAFHIYPFWYNQPSAAAWAQDMSTRIGLYSNRTVITEFGCPMTNGANYLDAASTSNDIMFFRGITSQLVAFSMGSMYWPGIRLNDGYSMQTICVNGTSVSLTTTNASGRDRLRYAWGCTALPVSYPVATASSSAEGGNWGVSKVIDGIRTSTACSFGWTSDPASATADKTEWVQIDYGANRQFNQVILYSRTDVLSTQNNTPGFPVDFTIQTLTDNGSVFATAKTVTGQPNPWQQPQTYTFSSVNARYVRVSASKLGLPTFNETGSRFTIAEIEVNNAPTGIETGNAAGGLTEGVGIRAIGRWITVGLPGHSRYAVEILDLQGKTLSLVRGGKENMVRVPLGLHRGMVAVVRVTADGTCLKSGCVVVQ
jgi:hypothetical protein